MKLSYTGPFIDFHTHVFPDKLFAAIDNWFIKNAGWNFHFKGTSTEIITFLHAIPNLERFVCFGYAHKPGIAAELNRFYRGLKELSPKAVPLACVHQDDENIASIAENAFDAGLPGFKLHCQVQKVTPDDTRLDSLYKVVAERKGFVLFHAGNGPFPGDCVGFDFFARFLKKYPDVRSVVAHLGCFESDKFLEAAISHDNLYLDTSYTFIANPTNYMAAPVALLEKARDKVFFASDFPGICHPYERSVDAITSLELSKTAREKIFYLNAKRFLGPLTAD